MQSSVESKAVVHTVPYFSIIVLAYQVEPYLAECLDSILAQTFGDYEIILVNPMCEDNTTEICQQYARQDARIHIIHPENRGQMLNRIAGYAAAQGKFFLCVDGDDRWTEKLLETVFDALQEQEAELTIFGHQRFQESRIITDVKGVFPHKKIFRGEEKKAVYEKYVRGGPINDQWGKVISKALFLRITEDFTRFEQLRNGEDLLYSVYATREADSILYLDRVLYQYRIRGNSISRKFRVNELSDVLYVKTQIESMLPSLGIDTAEYREMLYFSVASYLTDWIFRAATSSIPFKKKRELYSTARANSMFNKALPYMKRVEMSARHRMFVHCFMRGDYWLEAYAKLYGVIKAINTGRGKE